MPFQKGDPNINRKGRLNGAKNKNNAERDLARAVTTGMSLEDICELLSNKIQDPKVSEVQRNKYITQLISLKTMVVKEILKVEPEPKKKKEPKPSKPVGEVESTVVTEFPKPSFKRNQ